MSKHTTFLDQETQKLATDFIKNLKDHHIITLIGDLGAGKTTFTQGVASAFHINRVTSPTFNIIRSYPISNDSRFQTLYHIDLYRLTSLDQIIDLGVEEIWNNPKNLTLIEWPEKILHLLPPHLQIKITKLSLNKRQISISTINK